MRFYYISGLYLLKTWPTIISPNKYLGLVSLAYD